MKPATAQRLVSMFLEEEAFLSGQIESLIDEIESPETDETTREDRFTWLSNLYSDLMVIHQKLTHLNQLSSEMSSNPSDRQVQPRPEQRS